MSYHGDIALGSTIDIKFTSRRFSTGAPHTLAGSPAVAAYVDNGTSEITAGITLSVDFDSRTGLNNVRVVATSGNGFASGTNVQLVITSGTVDSVSVVGEVVGSFSIDNRSALRPATAGRALVVDAAGLADANMVKMGPSGSGTAQTARDIGASVLLSNGTGTGQIQLSSGVVRANDSSGNAVATASTQTTINNKIGTPGNLAGAGATLTGMIVDTYNSATGAAIGAGNVDLKLGNILDFGSGPSIARNLLDIAGATFDPDEDDFVLSFDPSTDSLEAIRNRGDAAWTGSGSAPTAEEVAAELLATFIASNVTVADALLAGASAGDPWLTPLPGSYSPGQAGYILGTNLDAAVSSRSTYAGADTSGTTTLLSRLTSTRAGYLDNLSAGAVATQASVDDVPTNSELASALSDLQTHGDSTWATATGFATAAALASAAGSILTAIDATPTNAELTSALGSLQSHGDATWSTATGFAVPGDAMTLTSGERTATAQIVLTTQMTESYRAAGAAPTLAQAHCELLAHHGSASNVGTVKTLYKFDGMTVAMTFDYADLTPTGIRRAA